MNGISVIDVGLYCIEENHKSSSEDDVRQIATKLYQGLRNTSCVILKNSGITQEQVSRSRQIADKFFQLDETVKSKYEPIGSENTNGWRREGSERTHMSGPWDVKEVFDMTLGNVKVWPKEVPTFQSEITNFFNHVAILGKKVLELIAISLNLDVDQRNFFLQCHNPGAPSNRSDVRMAYYPPLADRKDLLPGQMRCGEHTDFSSISFIFQDDVGGLEIKSSNGEYVAVPPIPDTVVLIVGQYMPVWTSDRLQGTMHRVSNPVKDNEKKKARRSTIYFYSPDNDTIVKCLDGSDKYTPRPIADFFKKGYDSISIK